MRRVAVIGGGIAGAAVAHLSELLGDAAAGHVVRTDERIAEAARRLRSTAV